MAANRDHVAMPCKHACRLAGWSGAVLLWLLPLVAMQFSDEVVWDRADFILFAGMLLAAGGACELAARAANSNTYRAAVAIAVATGFLLTWLNLAVGIIGSEQHPANCMYFAVPAMALAGALLARWQPVGIACALLATALVQALLAAIAWSAGWGDSRVLSAIFVALWLSSAWLFRRAARERTSTA